MSGSSLGQLLHGSSLVAGIGTDGIIIASDSRLVIRDDEDPGRPGLAFYDGFQKIYPIRNFAIGIKGTAIVGDVFISALISVFEAEMPKNIMIDSLLVHFILFCRKKLSKVFFHQVTGNIMIAIGYKKGVPMICVFQKENNQLKYTSGPMDCIETDPGGFCNPKRRKLNCDELAVLARATLLIVYLKYDRVNVGGPTAILKISPNNQIQWLIRPSAPKTWITLKDFASDYFNKKFELRFFKAEFKRRTDKLLLDAMAPTIGR